MRMSEEGGVSGVRGRWRSVGCLAVRELGACMTMVGATGHMDGWDGYRGVQQACS